VIFEHFYRGKMQKKEVIGGRVLYVMGENHVDGGGIVRRAQQEEEDRKYVRGTTLEKKSSECIASGNNARSRGKGRGGGEALN